MDWWAENWAWTSLIITTEVLTGLLTPDLEIPGHLGVELAESRVWSGKVNISKSQDFPTRICQPMHRLMYHWISLYSYYLSPGFSNAGKKNVDEWLIIAQ